MIPLIGSLSDLNQSANMALTSQRYLGESLTKMGAQIGETISQRQMFADAEKAAPFMQHAFLSAYDTIASGEPGSISKGLGMAIGASAQFATNPILARIGQEGVRTAGLMTNTMTERFQQDQQNIRTGMSVNAATGRVDDRQAAQIDSEIAMVQSVISDPNTPEPARQMNQQKLKELQTRRASIGQGQTVAAPTTRGLPIGTNAPAGDPAMPTPSSTPEEGLNEQAAGIATSFPNMSESEKKEASAWLNERGLSITENGGVATIQKVGQTPAGAVQPSGQGVAPTQAVASPTIATQPQGAAPRTTGVKSLIGTPQASLAYGASVLQNEKGKNLEFAGMTVDNSGHKSMSFKDSEGNETKLSASVQKSLDDFVGTASLLDPSILNRLGNYGGTLNSSLHFKGGSKKDETPWEMSMTVKVPTGKKDERGNETYRTQEIQQIERDPNGLPYPLMVSNDQKERAEDLSKSSAIVTNALKNTNIHAVINEGQIMNPREVMLSELPQHPDEKTGKPVYHLPYNMGTDESALKALGVDSEKVNDGTKTDFVIQAYRLLDDMVTGSVGGKSIKPEDPNGMKSYMDEFRKQAEDPKSKYKLNQFVSERKVEKKEAAPVVAIAETSLADDVKADIEENKKAEQDAGKWIGEAVSAIGKSFSDSWSKSKKIDALQRQYNILGEALFTTAGRKGYSREKYDAQRKLLDDELKSKIDSL